MISCILLSAGESSRFGSPKALAPIDAKTTVIVHLQETLIHSVLDEIVVVLGAASEKIKPSILNHKKVKVVYNKDYILGQTSSFKAGLRETAKEARACLLLPVDCPLVLPATVDHLIEAFKKHFPPVLVPVCENRRGHPPVFDMRLKPELLDLKDEEGVNTLIQRYQDEVINCSVNDRGVITSFNTQEEFARLKELRSVR